MFEIDDALLQTKYEQAQAQIAQAEATIKLAQQSLESANVQYQAALEANRKQNLSVESSRWSQTESANAELPNWYFEKNELIRSIDKEVEEAQEALEAEQKSLADTLEKASNKDFVQAEMRVNEAQTAFDVVDKTLTQAKNSKGMDKAVLEDAAQKQYDEAKTALKAAQKTYNAMLTGSAADDVKEARARVAAARARLENAQDQQNSLLTRDESLQVKSARISVLTAEANLDQAKAALEIAQAGLHEIEVTLQKLTVTAPTEGIVLSNPVKPGEIVSAGVTVYEIGNLDEVTLTVYVTEDQFGKINLGDKARVTVDSFPGETFMGEVIYISDQAEYTPRNIQTVESRSTTVYAVEIQLQNQGQRLKAGMPADAIID